MAVKTTYRAASYPALTGREPRYVMRSCAGYVWCIVDHATRLDVRQGTCESGDVPSAIRNAADRNAGQAFGYVEWPQ